MNNHETSPGTNYNADPWAQPPANSAFGHNAPGSSENSYGNGFGGGFGQESSTDWAAPAATPHQVVAPEPVKKSWGERRADRKAAKNAAEAGISEQPYTYVDAVEPSAFGSGFGETSATEAPAAWGYEASANQPAVVETQESEGRGAMLRDAFDKAKSYGGTFEDQFNRLPDPVRAVAMGAGKGALNELAGQYLKDDGDGGRKLKKTALIRAAVNPHAAGAKAIKGIVKGARQGGIEAAREQAPVATQVAEIGYNTWQNYR